MYDIVFLILKYTRGPWQTQRFYNKRLFLPTVTPFKTLYFLSNEKYLRWSLLLKTEKRVLVTCTCLMNQVVVVVPVQHSSPPPLPHHGCCLKCGFIHLFPLDCASRFHQSFPHRNQQLPFACIFKVSLWLKTVHIFLYMRGL